jgi:hypothetical protein
MGIILISFLILEEDPRLEEVACTDLGMGWEMPFFGTKVDTVR